MCTAALHEGFITRALKEVLHPNYRASCAWPRFGNRQEVHKKKHLQWIHPEIYWIVQG
jgi:hypothetical protein